MSQLFLNPFLMVSNHLLFRNISFIIAENGAMRIRTENLAVACLAVACINIGQTATTNILSKS
jgi:hypothetical protein